MGGKAERKQAPRRQVRGERTRERILDATLELLSREGPAAVSQRAVARAAGVSLGAMTYYFASQREMLASAFELHLGRTHARARALLEAGPSAAPGELDAEAMASGLAGFLASRVREDRARYMASFEIALELARDPVLREQLAPANAASNALAVELIGEIGGRRPEEDAYLIIAVLQGLTLQWLSAGVDSDYGERIEPLMRRFAAMLTASV